MKWVGIGIGLRVGVVCSVLNRIGSKLLELLDGLRSPWEGSKSMYSEGVREKVSVAHTHE